MKTFLKFTSILSIACTLLLAGCSSDDDGETTTPTEQPEQTTTIVDVAVATPALSSLVAALERAELVDTLKADGTFTVMAPTNAAFATFLSAKGFASLDDVPVPLLQQILLNHVIAADAPLNAADLITAGSGYTTTLSEGPDDGSNISLYFDAAGDVIFNGIATVETPDVEASNGIVHIVDAVIDLPTVVTFISADANLSTLADALITKTPNAAYIEFLSRSDDDISVPFTIFAPNNTAFEKLDALPEEDALASILANHIITGDNVRAEELTTGPSSATLEGDNLIFNVSTDGAISITDGTGNAEINVVEQNNIQAANGVVHSVDTVILPNIDN